MPILEGRARLLLLHHRLRGRHLSPLWRRLNHNKWRRLLHRRQRWLLHRRRLLLLRRRRLRGRLPILEGRARLLLRRRRQRWLLHRRRLLLWRRRLHGRLHGRLLWLGRQRWRLLQWWLLH